MRESYIFTRLFFDIERVLTIPHFKHFTAFYQLGDTFLHRTNRDPWAEFCDVRLRDFADLLLERHPHHVRRRSFSIDNVESLLRNQVHKLLCRWAQLSALR